MYMWVCSENPVEEGLILINNLILIHRLVLRSGTGDG